MSDKPKITFLFFLFLFIIPIVLSEEFYQIKHNCPFGCIINKTIEFNVTITNLAVNDLQIVSVKLINNANRNTIADSGESEITVSDPSIINSNKSKRVILSSKQSYLYQLYGYLPEPQKNNLLTYNFCLKTVTPITTWEEVGPTTEYCYKESKTVDMIDCLSDNDCISDEYCLDKRCTKLKCSQCQYPEQHKCNDYACCENSQCSLNQQCLNHECNNLDCPPDEFTVNNQCSKFPCNTGEIISNFTCIKAKCSEDEHIVNYSCTKLDCNFNEGIIDNRCIQLICNDNEGYVNNTCVLLQCLGDEYITNHTCTKLNCGFIQKPANHECVFNSDLLLQLVFLIILITLFILNTKKFLKGKKKNLVEKLMRIAKERNTNKSDVKKSDEKK